MKTSLAPGFTLIRTLMVNDARCIGFMGPENRVYATPEMINDMEYACRDLLLEHLDPGEDSVGAHVDISHLAATPMGMSVTITAEIIAIDKRRVSFAVVVRDTLEECGRGTHVRFVVDIEKSKQRIAAKRAKAGGI
jgi:predicted thioesterase